MYDKINNLKNCINNVILGKEQEVNEAIAVIIAGGNLLLEDIPGVGKTTLAMAFAKALDLDFKRVQFTPDVLPSDLTGFNMYRKDTNEFEFQQGSLFCNLLLADEINRTSPKTQSALLEAMEEHQVSVDGNTYYLPNPFIVIATQNPFGEAGTQLLPDTQLDRFMICMSLGYPDIKSEIEMAKTVSSYGRTHNIKPVMTKLDLIVFQQAVNDVFMRDELCEYAVKLVRATREHSMIQRGSSTRGVISLIKMAKSVAIMNGRDYVIPLDVSTQFKYVIKHRIVLNSNARLNNKTKDDIIEQIINDVKAPLPRGMK
ncbi:MAG: MoxR family ATPase [Lachnospiraceae bacterium]|nr:MoxR family ATPase [Lachnospiraceae bacterium]